MKFIGEILRAFLIDYLPVQRGLRPSSVKSYRDGLRLFLVFASQKERCKITKLEPRHFNKDNLIDFLAWLEQNRQNSVRTRNHRLAVLQCFCEYLASQMPEYISEAQRIATIQIKRCHPPETFFLEKEEVNQMLRNASAAKQSKLAFRDNVLLLFMYNTGARVQEVTDLKVEQLELDALRVRLHGKGGKWRMCPLWKETAAALQKLIGEPARASGDPVFLSNTGKQLTRFGIYKLVRKHTQRISKTRSNGSFKAVSPHTIRHSTAIHLLESGVEVNVIRGWLGHVSLDTTNRYAEINMRMKEEALKACLPPTSNETCHVDVRWKEDAALLKWLDSL
ncbi:MAG: site-specific integrase [Candidatus Obscuribacterales bacterium]|nr:site-specific integrase [Candidatus Obscuribacterales bacterium]